MVVVDSSTFDDEQFEQLKESVGVLIDESFDLAPDVARAGFIVYTDKVSVPVALGHYEDKIELLQKISDSDRISGQAIALKSLDAARQQFILHGRHDASKVIVLITNGNNRGNAALAAQDLREAYGIQIFAIAVNPTAERQASLARLVGSEYADTRLLKINNVQDLSGDQLSFIRQSLCGHITPAAGSIESTEPSWITTKRSSGFPM
uniref:VWFA domain-containing protein n=1 Tax=Panagrolaimus davidi TaxID=227884 RepID=A0A914Q3R1_9BILA